MNTGSTLSAGDGLSRRVGGRRGRRGEGSSVCVIIACLALVSLAIVGCATWSTNELKHKNEVLSSEAAISKAESEAKVRSLQRDYDKVVGERKALQDKLKAKKDDKVKDEGQDEGDIQKLKDMLEKLREEVQKIGKRDAIEKFGPGPHKVEIELDFPPEAPAVDGDPKMFIIELAPLDLVPHSVNLFLEMVSRGLWDGCSFMRNAGHVVQASPQPYYKNEEERLRRKFMDAGYMSVAFQEYSPDFPHKKYTVGFAGRPGGPDWYVSTVDNTKNHGPGGQSSYAIPGEADVCFGKVIEGFDAVDRMHKLPVKPGWYNSMENNVGIKARIL